MNCKPPPPLPRTFRIFFAESTIHTWLFSILGAPVHRTLAWPALFKGTRGTEKEHGQFSSTIAKIQHPNNNPPGCELDAVRVWSGLGGSRVWVTDFQNLPAQNPSHEAVASLPPGPCQQRALSKLIYWWYTTMFAHKSLSA